MQEIIYEPHPVTPERKAELRGLGYKIIDAQFDPSPKPESEGKKLTAAEKKALAAEKKAADEAAELPADPAAAE